MLPFFKKSLPKNDSNNSFILFEWHEILRSTDIDPRKDLEIQRGYKTVEMLDKNGNSVQEETGLIIHPMNDPKIVELNYHILSAIYQTNPTSIKLSITLYAMYAAIFFLKALAKNEHMLTSLNTEERSDDCSSKTNVMR